MRRCEDVRSAAGDWPEQQADNLGLWIARGLDEAQQQLIEAWSEELGL